MLLDPQQQQQQQVSSPKEQHESLTFQEEFIEENVNVIAGRLQHFIKN